MARAEDTEVIDKFEAFYRDYYRNEIGQLAQKYPNEKRSLYVDWNDLYRFDPDLADDFIAQPDQMLEYAEEALRLYDLPVDVKLGQAHVRVQNLQRTTGIRDIRARHRGQLVEVTGIVRKATDVRPKVIEAAFECQRCGTLTRIPQTSGEFYEPHECQGCERQGPFDINFDQSEFVDAQKLRIQESPEGLRGGETPQSIDVHIDDDITGEVTAGDHVRVTGVLHLDQQGSNQEKSPVFDVYMDGMAVEIEDEQFEDMDITDEDKKRIIELSNESDIYEKMIASMAPSIYGYDQEKLAIIMQLFSGVTKHLPDGSRTRGDLHMLLIGDPGTGKSQLLQYIRNLAPRSVYTSGKGSSSAGLCVTGETKIHTEQGFKPIRELVTPEIPEAVSSETAAERSIGLKSFDRERGELVDADSSHVWRMPEKPCRRIETRHGKELEASTQTPVLVCGADGIEWREIAEVEAGDYVGVPRNVSENDTSDVSVRDFLELSTEKALLSDESVTFFRDSLTETFGTLRDAAAELDLSEDFIYLHLKNRHVPIKRIDRMIDAVGASRSDVQFDRLMVRHGDGITVPDEFDSDLMYLIGLVFGDGDISLNRRDGNRGMVRISNGNESILERASDIFAEKFDKHPEIERQENRVPSIRVDSVTISRLFSNVGMQTPKADLSLAPELTTSKHTDAFLRGLMDADGSVSQRDSGGSSVLISTISDELAQQVQLMLETYGVQASVRERDRRGTYELTDGRTIESKHIQHFVEIYGADIDRYAEAIGFESESKTEALEAATSTARRQKEKLPVGSALVAAEGPARTYYGNLVRGDNPSRERAESMIQDLDMGPIEQEIRETVDADLRWDEVIDTEDTGRTEVFDVTVPDTHNFVGNGIVTHNTAAAVRDDFGDGQQWTLEAGALVLADQGIAAVDELDKMRCVTGDTAVRTSRGSKRSIGALAAEETEHGTVETLDNGRTIRDVDVDVVTMTDDERLVERPVTAIHEYDAPSKLVEVTLESGVSLTATPDHPFFVREQGDRVERGAAKLRSGDAVFVPEFGSGARADGGGNTRTAGQFPDGKKAVALSRVAETRRVENDGQWASVYDLTVEGTHNFVANGMVVHNSEDRSAMHEALEQQSYHPDTELLLADGRRVEIGEFVDDHMASDPEAVVDGVDCEILPIDDARVHSTDLDTNGTSKVPVDRVSRHEAPEAFVRVAFSNGRAVTVTPEHPMFVDDEGSIGTVEARDLEEGAFVPAPRKLPNSSATVELDDEPHRGNEKDVRLPTELSGDLAELLGFLVAEGHSYAGSSHEIGFSNQDKRLLSRMDDLVSSVFGMESTDTTNAAGTVTKRWVSTKLYRWFESTVPGVMRTARDKRIPDRVLGASEEAIRRFLVGAFAGDGGAESEAMSFSTASDGLAEDYADALSKIGVASRIHHDAAEDSWKVYVMGDSTEQFVDSVVDPADERYEDAMAFVDGAADEDDIEDSSGLRYYRVTDVETIPNDGENACEWVYDVTVEPTNTFVSSGVVLHNSISISKAGINATLKSRCSLLGAANPKYGRFDQYEPIGEQIDLEPALISRFDLIFTVTDQPDAEEDANLAEHIINTNYAGELHTHRENTTTSNVSEEEVQNVTEEVEPEIDAELLRKYVAYAKRNCYPMMTEEAKAEIRDFYVDLRAKGQDEDAPVPVTARKLEALVRLAEASARMRLSDTVDSGDAERVIEIVRSCLQDIGVDPETGEFDADVVETGQSKTQRDRIKNVKSLIGEIESEYDEGAPIETILDRAEEVGMERSQAEHEIEKLRRQGDVYEPTTDHLRTV
jgi:DNA replicative helicase MCM subunit Mcm2 (Cdc46/Mcm family)